MVRIRQSFKRHSTQHDAAHRLPLKPLRPPTIACLFVTAIACLTLVYCLRMGWLQVTGPAKFISSAGFLATALSVGAMRHAFGRMIFLGLTLSMAGDLLLLGQSQSCFLLGLSSFLVAHLAYIVAFIVYGQNRLWAALSALPMLLIAGSVLHWLNPFLGPGLRFPVYAYTAVITIMVIAAIGARGAGASRWLLAGALMFYGSDLSVAMQRIVMTEFPTFIWGLPLYYAAQSSIALSASRNTGGLGLKRAGSS